MNKAMYALYMRLNVDNVIVLQSEVQHHFELLNEDIVLKIKIMV